MSRWVPCLAALLAGVALAEAEAPGDPVEEQLSLLEFLGSFDADPEAFSEFFDSVPPQPESRESPGAAVEGEK